MGTGQNLGIAGSLDLRAKNVTCKQKRGSDTKVLKTDGQHCFPNEPSDQESGGRAVVLRTGRPL